MVTITCAISRLAIEEGTPVRLFLLGRPVQSGDGMIFRPHHAYIPLSPGLAGEYRGNYRPENLWPSPAFDLALKYFLPECDGDVEAAINEILMSESPVRITLDNHGHAVPCDVTFTYVREDVYQALLSLQPDNVVSRDRVQSQLGFIRDTITGFQDRFRHTEISADHLSIYCRDFEKTSFFAPVLKSDREQQLLHAAFKHYRNIFLERLKDSASVDKEMLDISTEIAEFTHIHERMHDLALLWQPFTHMASDRGIHASFSKAVMAICAQSEVKADHPPAPVPGAPAPR